MAKGQMLLFPIHDAPVTPVTRMPALVAKPTPAAPAPAHGHASSSAQAPLAKGAKPSLDALRAQINRLHSRPMPIETITPVYSAGGKALDSLLPHGGLRPGTIVQWVGDTGNDRTGDNKIGGGAGGEGAASLAMIAAAEIAASSLSGGKPLVIFDCARKVSFYPPAAIALGLPADRMVVVKKQDHHNHADMIWAIDQALRCDAVAAVWAELGPWVNDRDARRLQLAAEIGGTVGLFVRPMEVRRRPSFSDVSWFVTPHTASRGALSSSANSSGRRLRVEVDRCRGGVEGAVAWVEISSASAAATATAPRVAAFHPPAILSPTGNRNESTMARDLARQLAHPAAPKRRPDADDKRIAM